MIKFFSFPFVFLLFFSCTILNNRQSLDFNQSSSSLNRYPASLELNCQNLISQILKSPTQDTSIELEIPINPLSIKLLTTENDLVSGLVKNHPLPKWYLKWAKKFYPEFDDPTQIPWIKLDKHFKIQKLLLIHVTKFKSTSFSADRRLHGVKIRDTILLSFDRETEFLGKVYPKGKHDIDVSDVFGVVQYRGPKDVEKVKGIEIHFRTNLPSGILSRDAWTLLDGLNLGRQGQHVHIVSPIPKELYEKRSKHIQIAKMGEFFSRANLLSEMITLVIEKGLITTVKDYTTTYFDSLSLVNLQGVVDYFIKKSAGLDPKIGDQFKIGWIGMRGSDKYDEPNLWGIEYRAIGPKDNPHVNQTVLNALQWSMQHNSYGFSDEEMQSWLDHMNYARINDLPQIVRKTWYNRDWQTLINEANPLIRNYFDTNPGIRGFFTKLMDSNLRKQFSKNKAQIINHGDFHKELKMLLHDWSNSPLIYSNESLKNKVISLQVDALDKILKLDLGEAADQYVQERHNKINFIIRNFLLESGLFELHLKSFGINQN